LKHQSTPRLSNPGPGSYDINYQDTKRGPSIRGKYDSPVQDRVKTAGPSPASYTPDKQYKVRGFRLVSPRGTGTVDTKYQKPGPGAYSPAAPKPIGSIFSKTATPHGVPTKKPGAGPGTYEITENVGKESPRYTFTGRATELRKDNTPGPDSYSQSGTSINSPRTRNVSMGTSERYG